MLIFQRWRIGSTKVKTIIFLTKQFSHEGLNNYFLTKQCNHEGLHNYFLTKRSSHEPFEMPFARQQGHEGLVYYIPMIVPSEPLA